VAWEKRGKNARYFYRSVRRGGKVRKEYCGAGAIGNLAAGVEALGRGERRAAKEASRAELSRVENAAALLEAARAACALLVNATLLALGFHRPSRHGWRCWYAGRRWLRNRHATGGRGGTA
jgi:hypothetical protein